MLGRSTGAVLLGIDARLVEVEVHLGGGLPTISTVGLPDAAVREGIDRIRAALRHAGFQLPQHRVIVNLAPAEVRKHGTSLDLPMAVALLEADGQIPGFRSDGSVLVGELGLDGALRPVRGTLPIALAARDRGKRRLVVPRGNAEEALLAEGIDVIAASSLADVVAVARAECAPARRTLSASSLLASAATEARDADLADVRGQAGARRALEVAAAGGHHLLLSGPPGAGKSMLARRLAGILPPLQLAEALEVTKVWSAAGLASALVTRRPFRAPHHGITSVAMTGGGALLRPGEISLASQGVLHLDELPEFRREVLEALRQPLEEGAITVVRLRAQATFPAQFQLVASMNPCACGWHGDPRGRCRCTPQEVRRYWAKLSGPLLDRFDLVVDVPPVELADLVHRAPGESSARVRERVVAAREIQQRRFESIRLAERTCNAQLGPADLDRFAPLCVGCRRLLESACRSLGLSARGFDRVRRVARTLADLEGNERIEERHMAEAVQYRREARPYPEGRR